MPITGQWMMVYDYRFWDPVVGEMVESRVPATLEAIRSGLGVALTNTGRWVTRSAVDGSGRLRPEATKGRKP
jgi:hypothetical protein